MPHLNNVKRPWLKRKPAPPPQLEKPDVGQDLPKDFYRLAPWKNFRARFLEREPLCRACKTERKLTPARVLDHIVPIRQGGAVWDENNLQPLCDAHHQRKRQTERRER